ncbi:MAG TPA: hypothetical protein VFO89_16740, partial [Thermoanaerobaculia bacterium]|nr:hypothetical protein [Thermoanaerobaculia bacterium]
MKSRSLVLLVCLPVLLFPLACTKKEAVPPQAEAPPAATSTASAMPPDCSGGSGCAGSTCPSSITASAATLPTDACPNFGEVQGGADVFSWNSFLALNWPAASNCTADTTKSILNVTSSSGGPVVWQTLMSSDDVFVPPGQTPAPWCADAAVSALFAGKPRDMKNTAKADAAAHALGPNFAAIADPTGVEAVGGVVTDQSGRWLRFERYMNKIEYDAIVDPKNNWWQLSVLNKLSSITLPTGSLELKAAWKVLTPQEIASNRYYTTVATVYNTPAGAPSPGTNPVTLGLVGLHIIQKTPSQSGFFWSTFEQVDNDATFLNPSGPTNYNQQTAQKPFVELQPNGQPNNAPVQIKRVNQPPVDAALNAYYQKLLGNSVFHYYRLISTQWQT